MLTIVLVSFVLLAFVLMTRGILKQEVAMPLLALVAISLAGNVEGAKALREGFAEFSRIALLFTAVAVPAHILQRSKLLDWVGMRVGELIGDVHKLSRISVLLLVPLFGLTMIYIMAALFHNTTSILVGSVILFVICKSYKLKGLPVLAGALVASNLGGFSTRWGDTPNIIESAQWGLTHADFATEILPLNISALGILIATITTWLWITMRRKALQTGTKFEITYAKIGFRNSRRNMSLDNRLVFVGLIGLGLAIVGPLFLPGYELIFSSAAIIWSVLLDYDDHRAESLFALGIETYGTLASIFVLAQVLAHSSIGIGSYIEQWLVQSGMSIWSIATASYVGTLLTEAASWASAAAPIVFSQAPTHAAAWALGSGIFAGSSSLVTAASAGIILTRETKWFSEDSQVTFGSYIGFGLPFSLVMLGYYIVMLTLFYQ